MVRGSRPRFSFLERALKAAGGTPAAGSRLGNYAEFKKGNRAIEVSKKLSPAQRKRYAIALVPFNKTPADTTAEKKYRTTITQYSNEGRKLLTTLTDTKLGFFEIAAGNQPGNGYYPAILRLFVPTNAETPTKTNPTSGITGQKYSRTAGASYTVPFGRLGSDLTQGEEVRRLELIEDAKTGNGADKKATGITCEPEYFANAQADVPALPVS